MHAYQREENHLIIGVHVSCDPSRYNHRNTAMTANVNQMAYGVIISESPVIDMIQLIASSWEDNDTHIERSSRPLAA